MVKYNIFWWGGSIITQGRERKCLIKKIKSVCEYINQSRKALGSDIVPLPFLKHTEEFSFLILLYHSPAAYMP